MHLDDVINVFLQNVMLFEAFFKRGLETRQRSKINEHFKIEML